MKKLYALIDAALWFLFYFIFILPFVAAEYLINGGDNIVIGNVHENKELLNGDDNENN